MAIAERARGTTWRQILTKNRHAFLRWLDESGEEQRALQHFVDTLSAFLIVRLRGQYSEGTIDPHEFWTRIPEVRACCNDVTTFDKPFAVEAYAYVHMPERYRRTWEALKHLTRKAALPLGDEGVRVLDVGTGPAPALYAVDDFYHALSTFAASTGVSELIVPPPQLDSIERSQTMTTFFHHFSEYSNRSGPFGPAFHDFAGLDLQERRAVVQHQREYEQYWDPETQQYEEFFDPAGAAEYANRLHRYRLVIFSNFLTLEAEVQAFETELRRLFADLRPGAIVIVLGGTGDRYQAIYDRIADLARESGLFEAAWHTDSLGRMSPTDVPAQTIKQGQFRVYVELQQLVGLKQLTRDSAWPDYWDPVPSAKARPQFALRIFRRGRWPRFAPKRSLTSIA